MKWENVSIMFILCAPCARYARVWAAVWAKFYVNFVICFLPFRFGNWCIFKTLNIGHGESKLKMSVRCIHIFRDSCCSFMYTYVFLSDWKVYNKRMDMARKLRPWNSLLSENEKRIRHSFTANFHSTDKLVTFFHFVDGNLEGHWLYFSVPYQFRMECQAIGMPTGELGILV